MTTLVQKKQGAVAFATTCTVGTFTTAPAIGNKVFLVVEYQYNGTISITDNGTGTANTWTKISGSDNSPVTNAPSGTTTAATGQYKIAIFEATLTRSFTTLTVTNTGSSVLQATYYELANAGIVRGSWGFGGSASTPGGLTTPNGGQVAGVAGDFVIAALSYFANTGYTAATPASGSGFTNDFTGGTSTTLTSITSLLLTGSMSAGPNWSSPSGINGTGQVGIVIETVVSSNPTASFTDIATGLSVVFSGTGTPVSPATIASWDYNWGDSTSHGTTQNPTHVYTAAGTYSVVLTVTDNNGLTGSYTGSVTVVGSGGAGGAAVVTKATSSGNIATGGTTNYIPIPGVTSGVSGTAPAIGDQVWIAMALDVNGRTVTVPTGWTSVVASDNGSGHSTIITKTWATGDATTYATNGVPMVLTTSGNNGSWVYLLLDGGAYGAIQGTGTFTVRTSSQTTTAPHGSMPTGYSTLVFFTEKSTSQTSLAVQTSGATTLVSKMPNTGAAGAVVAATYSTVSTTEDITALSSNAANANGAGIQIALAAGTGVVTPGTPPVAAFTASSTDRVLSVNGTTSTVTSPATISSYDWDWGDGTTHGSGSTATHTYGSDGTFSVILKVTDSTAANNSVTHSETVANRTQAVEWGDGTAKQPAWLWWADGTAKQPVHAYHIVGSGAASVSALLAKPGFVVGHMGDSGDTAQGSMQSITDGLVRGNKGIDACMLSVQVTSDGIYFPLNDIAYLDGEVLGNAAGTTLDPRTMTWATILSTYQIGPYYLTGAPSTPKYNFVNMNDIRAAYPNLVIFIDPKTIPSTGYAALLSWMAANGGTTKFVAKGYYNMSAWFTAARAAGYKTWGYMYEADYTADTTRLGTYGPALDILGMEYGATSPTWATFTSYTPTSGPNSGVVLPCMGFIAPNLTAYNTCIAAGAKGVMVSGVKSVLGA